MNGDCFYTAVYGNFGDGGKATQRSPIDNTAKYNGFARKGIGKVGRSVREYLHLVVTTQV